MTLSDGSTNTKVLPLCTDVSNTCHTEVGNKGAQLYNDTEKLHVYGKAMLFGKTEQKDTLTVQSQIDAARAAGQSTATLEAQLNGLQSAAASAQYADEATQASANSPASAAAASVGAVAIAAVAAAMNF